MGPAQGTQGTGNGQRTLLIVLCLGLITKVFSTEGKFDVAKSVVMGFCNRKNQNEERFETHSTQPSEHLERFHSYDINHTHFSLEWSADERLCGNNVTEYWVSVDSNSWIINAALSFYGHFPQSTCGNSKGNSKVRTQDGSVPNACSPYRKLCHNRRRQSTLALPTLLWPLIRWARIAFRVQAWGSLAKPVCHGDDSDCQNFSSESIPVDFWCLVFKYKGTGDIPRATTDL